MLALAHAMFNRLEWIKQEKAREEGKDCLLPYNQARPLQSLDWTLVWVLQFVEVGEAVARSRAFLVVASTLWNSLPLSLWTACSFEAFQQGLKHYSGLLSFTSLDILGFYANSFHGLAFFNCLLPVFYFLLLSAFKDIFKDITVEIKNQC